MRKLGAMRNAVPSVGDGPEITVPHDDTGIGGLGSAVMRLTRVTATVMSGLIALGAAAAPAAAATGGGLKSDLDAILKDKRLDGATVDLIVRDARTGKVLYDHGSDRPVTPASNNKIQTSTAAFGLLGGGYRFRTSVSTKGGDLYLTGTGDPTMRAAQYDRLAKTIAAAGIKQVKGDLVADDTWFDAKRTAPDWDPTDLPYSYAAPISALTVSPDDEFDAGSINVRVTPGDPGDPAHAELTPKTGVVKLDNRAKTGKAGSASTLNVTRENGTIVVKGSYPADGAAADNLVSVANPTRYAADVFRRALKRHGVTVAGGIERGRTPAGARRVATHRSIPLSKLATPFLKLSNNGIAETLVKSVGRVKAGQGSWSAGLPLVKAYLKRMGEDTGQVTLTDGSGLSNTNRTTARQLSNALLKARTRPWFRTWYDALPIAGKPDPMVGGTLAERMAGTAAAGNVHAKTGSLTGATALSGYVTGPKGRKLVFSSVFNGYQGDAPKDIEDKIAVRLASGKNVSTKVLRAGRNGGGDLECSWTRTC